MYKDAGERIKAVKEFKAEFSRALQNSGKEKKDELIEYRKFLVVSFAYLAVNEADGDVRTAMAEAARSLISARSRLQDVVADIVAGMVALQDADEGASLQKHTDRLLELPEEALRFVGEYAQDEELSEDIRKELAQVLVNSGSVVALEPLLRLLESGKCAHKRLPYIGIKNILKKAQIDENGMVRQKRGGQAGVAIPGAPTDF